MFDSTGAVIDSAGALFGSVVTMFDSVVAVFAATASKCLCFFRRLFRDMTSRLVSGEKPPDMDDPRAGEVAPQNEKPPGFLASGGAE